MQDVPDTNFHDAPTGEVAAAQSASANTATMPNAKVKVPHVWHISRERVHELAVMRGRLGGRIGGKMSHGGGRPRGEPRKPVAMPQSAYDTFRICSEFDGKTRVQFLADYAKELRTNPRYAHLFAN